ncbi:MAG: hypothetical protein AB7U83_02780 [Vicinamibacterales bacterium]
MPGTTRVVGLILAVLGIVSYVGTGRTSVTALIPAFFGVVFLVLAWLARNEAARKHVMHAAMLVALVGIGGTGSRLIGATDFTRPATIAQVVTVLVFAWYLGQGIKSFRDARRARA